MIGKFALAACAALLCPAARAQGCAPPPIVANAKSANMFTPEQETIFGELTLENMARDVRLVRDERLRAYLDELGARLVKHLPPTGLRFQFHLIDLPEANAFNTPGGHVFVSRKLVAFVQNEDELAGVLAHELGHATVHHGAADMSEALRRVLGVTSLGDRRDITEKYNLLIERARTKSFSRKVSHENEQQLEADRIGLFAMVAAGYDPSAFSAFFDRLTEAEGKTGNWFSDLFGGLRPEQKRLREMIRITDQLPAACREGRAARASEGFLKWQAEVVSFREAARKEELPGLLWRRELAPKLRSDVSRLAFSPDGKYLLAQDDFAVTVLERDPFRVLFQIPVENADAAAFTPDSRSVVFTTENLRFERWSVAEQKPAEVRELVLRRDCWEHQLSPDGNYLACVDTSTTVNVIDTKTGKKLWEKKEFYPLSFFEYVAWLGAKRGDRPRRSFFRVVFSPDSRYVVFSRTGWFRFQFRINGLTAVGSENTALALDLSTMKAVDLGGELKKIASRPFVFTDAATILGMPTAHAEDSGLFSFPAGKRLRKLTFGGEEVEATANPDYYVVRPVTNAKTGVFDLKQGLLLGGFQKEDVAVWNNLLAYESVNGKLLLREMAPDAPGKTMATKDVGSVELPVSSIGSLDSLSAAEVSDNFRWLALSSRTRGGVWDLGTGERKFYVRGFRGGVVGNDGASVEDFPRQDEARRSLVLLNPANQATTPIRELPDKGAQQYGRFVLLRHSLKAQGEAKGRAGEGQEQGRTADEKGKEKKAENKAEETAAAPPAPEEEAADEGSLRENVRFELKDIVQDKVVWSHDYAKEAPDFSFDPFSGRLITYWRLGGEAGKARLRESPELQARADALGSKAEDYLVEIVDAFAQKAVGAVFLETGRGSFNVGRGLSEGDWLVLRDTEGRVLVYAIKEGELRHRFFGNNAALNPRRNQLAVENFPGEFSVYDLGTGERLARFNISGNGAFLRFNLDGSRLLVLSGSQTAYAFDVDRLAAQPPAAAAK